MDPTGPLRACGTTFTPRDQCPNASPLSLYGDTLDLFEISALTELLRGGVVGWRQICNQIVNVLHHLPLVNNNFRWWHIDCVEPFWKSTKVAPQLKIPNYNVSQACQFAWLLDDGVWLDYFKFKQRTRGHMHVPAER